VSAALTALADWIDAQLSDELASRQHVAETALARIEELATCPVLTAADLGVLGQALADAVTYRDPAGFCQDCEDSPAALCQDHADDLDKTDAYLALAAGLGLEIDR
jgi:hypothetical protein